MRGRKYIYDAVCEVMPINSVYRVSPSPCNVEQDKYSNYRRYRYDSEEDYPKWYAADSCLRPGYIGGTVLARLLQHPNASSFDITVLVRSAEKGKIPEDKFGVKAVIGSYHEHDKLASLAEGAQVVFQIVSIVFLYCVCLSFNVIMPGRLR